MMNLRDRKAIKHSSVGIFNLINKHEGRGAEGLWVLMDEGRRSMLWVIMGRFSLFRIIKYARYESYVIREVIKV